MFSIQIQKVFFFPSEVWIKDIIEQWIGFEWKGDLHPSLSPIPETAHGKRTIFLLWVVFN